MSPPRLHNMVNFGLLAAEICCLRDTGKFQRVSCLDSVTVWHSSSGHQPNFVALNRGRHLYSAGRPSHWVLSHISSWDLNHDFEHISPFNFKYKDSI